MRKSGKSRSGISKRKGWVSCRNHTQDSQKSLPLHSRKGESQWQRPRTFFSSERPSDMLAEPVRDRMNGGRGEGPCEERPGHT